MVHFEVNHSHTIQKVCVLRGPIERTLSLSLSDKRHFHTRKISAFTYFERPVAEFLRPASLLSPPQL